MLELFVVFGIIPIILALLQLRHDRRSFFGGITLMFGIGVLLFLVILGILNQIAGISEIAVQTTLIFTLGGVIGLPIVIGVALILNSQVMKQKEGRSLTAQLSLLFGFNFIIIAGLSLAVLFRGAVWNQWLVGTMFLFLMVDVTLTGVFIGYLFYSLLYQLIPIKQHVDYIITLGAGVRSDKLTPLLKSRVDKGLEYYRKQGDSGMMVPSGGQGPDEPVSEAYAMGKYLTESQHVDPKHIILEDESTNTMQNMLFSKKKIEQDWHGDRAPKVIFSTNNYHVLRSAIYAKRAGLQADGVGAPTSFYFLPSALLREFIALMMMYKWFLITVVGFWIVITGLMFLV
nr:YdcF family protein [Pediococcus claussenii]